MVADVLQIANWQRNRGNGGRPKPVQRPRQKTRIGRVVLDIDELDKRLGYSPQRMK